jgi:2-polyprenyl-3-methyl-5-hydroxy-6-metoxy-1,4-benzoquinol methylase
MTDQTAVTARPTGPDSHAESQDLWDLRNLAEARRLCDFQFEQVPSDFGRRVLEVGAGIGTFSERLLANGAEELLLIEPETACVAELEEKFAADPRVTVRAELLPDAPSLADKAGHFDFALSQNVLEHIEDDYAAMAAMARAVRPGGQVMALVPAHPRLYGAIDQAFGHYRRYTRERLRAITEAAGLEVERLYSFNALGLLGWWAKKRTGAQDIGSSPLKAYEALLTAWAPIERRIELPVGLSVIVHARKPQEGAHA